MHYSDHKILIFQKNIEFKWNFPIKDKKVPNLISSVIVLDFIYYFILETNKYISLQK